jgi:tetratricopeptide (TPR) repeat protein
LTHTTRGAKIENMPHVAKFILAALISIAIFVGPARAQDKTPAPKKEPTVAPVVDPNAANYTDRSIYVPPGAVKSVEIGNFYLKKKKYKGALSRFQEAVVENSTYAPAYLGMGKVYEHMGLKQKALDAYQKYLDALPSEKDALDAKDVRRAMARLERELTRKSQHRPGHASKAETTHQSQ